MSQTARRIQIALWAVWLAFAVFTVWGVWQVPFHPDESTYLYMSRDFDRLFLERNPPAVTWKADSAAADVTRYRLLDAPLSHYLPGLGRWLAGYAGVSLPVDWNWSLSWDANARAGALPEPGLLAAGRLPAALLTAFSPLLIAAIGTRLHSWPVGVLAAVLYGLCGLVLLHGRRAMGEGPLLFFSLLTFWAVLLPNRPVLAGAGTALASAAKLTGLALLPVAVVAALLPGPSTENATGPQRRGPRLRQAAILLSSFMVFSVLLNPALWAAPLAGIQAMIDARRNFMAAQAAVGQVAAPGLLLDNTGDRWVALLYHGYLAPLSYWDVPNYAAQTRLAELSYQANWVNTGQRMPWSAGRFAAGGLELALGLAGLSFAGLAWVRRRASPGPGPDSLRALALLAVWTVTTTAGLLSINVAWQRYYLPLAPIACLWAAYGIAIPVQAGRRPGAARAEANGG